MDLKKPALNPTTVNPRTGSTYPEVFRSRVTPRQKFALGDALGLTQFGVNLTVLYPGKESSLRHYHLREDEFVFVLEGELILKTNCGEQTLTAGMCAGFPAGSKDGHHLINRSQQPAKYLEVGSRIPGDEVSYTDEDLSCKKNEAGTWIFSHKDGSPYP